MIAKLTPFFCRWIERAKNAALLGGIAAGCVYGYAHAISPTIDGDRDFVSGVNLVAPDVSFAHPIYTVPAGRLYTLTDVIIANQNAFHITAQVFASDNPSCSPGAARISLVVIPAQDTVHLPLNTGIGFAAGKVVCLLSSSSSVWTLRGYLSSAT